MENENNSNLRQGIKRKLSRSVMLKFVDDEANDQNNQEKYDSLPDDVLILIIKYLPITQWPSMERVNQKFQRAVYGAWRHSRQIRLDEDFISNQCYDPNEILRLIANKLLLRSPYLISISDFGIFQGNESKAIDENVIRVLAQFQYLEFLFIVWITDKDLARFLETSKCRGRLKRLDAAVVIHDASFVHKHDEKLLTERFDDITDRPKLNLEELRISKINHPDERMDYYFLETMNVASLTKLDLFECKIISTDLARLINRCVQLKDVSVAFTCPVDCRGPRTNPHGTLIEALKALENLSILSLDYKGSKCMKCFDQRSLPLGQFVQYLGLHRPITKLSATRWICDDYVVLSIATFMVHLISLDISMQDCDADSIILIRRMINLRKLKIVFPLNLENGLLLDLSTIDRLECLHLTNVTLTNNEIQGNAVCIDYNKFIQLSNLKEFHIDCCHWSNRLFADWNDHANWNLDSFEFSFSNRTAPNLLSFLNKMTGLRYLALKDSAISNCDLIKISKMCPNLVEIDLSGSSWITADGIQKIVDECSELKRIKMSCKIRRRELKINNQYRNLKLVHSYEPGNF